MTEQHLDPESQARLNAAARRTMRGLDRLLDPNSTRGKGLRVVMEFRDDLLPMYREDLVVTLRLVGERAKDIARRLREP